MRTQVLKAIFSVLTRLVRKARKHRRFNKDFAARALRKRINTYWSNGIDAIFAHLNESKGWDRLHDYVARQQLVVEGQVEKALSDGDRALIVELLRDFGYYDDLETVAAAIVEATRFDTFEEAATSALKNLGIAAPDFELRNPAIQDALRARASAEIFATRNNIDAVMGSIVRNFYDLGRNPYDKQFIAELRSQLGDVTRAQAERFALTETAIAAEYAQLETYRRNGVQRKQWNALGERTRPSHAAMDGKQADMDKPFLVASSDGATYPCASPSDPTLPAHELINCRCWMTPVVDDDYQLDPAAVWEGD